MPQLLRIHPDDDVGSDVSVVNDKRIVVFLFSIYDAEQSVWWCSGTSLVDEQRFHDVKRVVPTVFAILSERWRELNGWPHAGTADYAATCAVSDEDWHRPWRRRRLGLGTRWQQHIRS